MKINLPGQLEFAGPELSDQLSQKVRRAAAANLKPAVAQQPCDVGLFSDDAAQIDLADLLK